jgi:Uma2 family endonuclease
MPASETAAAPAPVRWTREHVLDLMERSPTHWPRYELVDGELLVTPAPGVPHQELVQQLLFRFLLYLRAHPAGRVFVAPADIALAPDRRSIVQPDLFVIPAGSERPRTWRDMPALLLAVEVVSPGSATHDRGAKREHYLGHGVPDYWIVDPDLRQVERWRPGAHSPEIARDAIEWSPLAHPPLRIELGPFFDEALGPLR